MKKTIWLVLACMVLFPMRAGADAYKCRTKDGKVIYTNQLMTTLGVTCEQMFVRKPPVVIEGNQTGSEEAEGGAPAESLPEKANNPPQAAADAAAAKAQADKEAEAKRKREEAEAANKKAREEAIAAQKKLKEQNCQNARANLAAYQTGRVRKVNEKGEWYYLDEAAIKEHLEQAQKDVAENCN
ncbi:MAG: DUF4124 domain-containing protein [Methylophilaceae bacterium]|nr:DUF4124 domain-containing protein [Methylophilaceae bacterium]